VRHGEVKLIVTWRGL